MHELTDLTVSMVLNDLVPFSKLMAEQIMALRQWAKGCKDGDVYSGFKEISEDCGVLAGKPYPRGWDF